MLRRNRREQPPADRAAVTSWRHATLESDHHALDLIPEVTTVQYQTPPDEMMDALRYIINARELAGEAPLPKLIGVTSSIGHEGVTTVSHALAAVLAADFLGRVCWVDLSWARSSPRPSEGDELGLFDLFAGRADIHEVLMFARDLGVDVLAAGNVPEHGSHFLARSKGLETLVDSLTATFDHVVFDMPPVLESTAGLPVFRFLDAYLLVVRAGVTRIDQVEHATERVALTPNIGAVLNGENHRVPRVMQRILSD